MAEILQVVVSRDVDETTQEPDSDVDDVTDEPDSEVDDATDEPDSDESEADSVTDEPDSDEPDSDDVTDEPDSDDVTDEPDSDAVTDAADTCDVLCENGATPTVVDDDCSCQCVDSFEGRYCQRKLLQSLGVGGTQKVKLSPLS